MNWLFPAFLLGALAVSIPIALHLLRRFPPRPMVFPSLMFLTASSRDLEHRWHRVRRWLVLALRCAVFGLVAMAFARPYFTGAHSHPKRAIVVVVDNSFSLQAKGLWPALQRWTRDKVGTPGPGDRLGVLLMGPQPTWLVAPTVEVGRPLRALDELSPGWLTARAEPALRFAGETLATTPADRREIVFWSDHQRLTWAGTDFRRQLPSGVAVIFPDPPPAVARQAALQAPRLAVMNAGLAGFVTIRNFTGPQQRTLRVYTDGSTRPLYEEAIELAANEVRTVHIALPGAAERGGWFRFALDPDDLPADDTAYATWQPTRDGTILLDPAPPDSPTDFVKAALAAAATANPPLMVAAVPAGPWPTTAIAVLRNDATFAGFGATNLDAFLTAGGEAIIFASDGGNEKAWLARHGVETTPLSTRSNRRRVEHWAVDHPLVAEFSRRRLEDLLGWEFTRGWGFPVNAAQPLAYWSDSGEAQAAAVSELRVGAGSALICGFTADRESGDWPVTPAFVPFLHRAATYLMRTEQATTRFGVTGQAVELGGKTGRWESIETPVPAKVDLQVAGTVTPMEPGVYRFTSGTNAALFAINVPLEESDPAIWTTGTPWKQLVSAERASRAQGGGLELSAVDAEEKASLWWWVVALAIALMLAEVTLANRTAR